MKNPKKIAALVGAMLLILVAAVAYGVLWTGSTTEIEAVANKFQPGESWKLVDEQIKPPRYICLDGGACPELNRTWSSPQGVTKGQFMHMLPIEYNSKVTGNCPETLSETPPTGANCYASGSLNGYTTNIIYDFNPQLKNNSKVIINVRKDA